MHFCKNLHFSPYLKMFNSVFFSGLRRGRIKQHDRAQHQRTLNSFQITNRNINKQKYCTSF